MPEYIDVFQLMNYMMSDKQFDLVDVRSPAEYSQAHFPGSLNIPLLDDEARHKVGVCYKKFGQEAAVEKGFELSGPRFHQMISDAKNMDRSGDLIIYCWRGGLRSRIMSWILETAGIKNVVIEGGYKAFRQACLKILEQKYDFIILGGATGTGKTLLLEKLQKMGEAVIDLEALANHRGSVFGGLGLGRQPRVEQFENLLALELLKHKDASSIWLENESRSIGTVKIPNNIYDQIRASNVISIDAPLDLRKKIILDEYGQFSVNALQECTEKLAKKLGGDRLKIAIDALREGDKSKWLDVLLEYYDENYNYSNNKRSNNTIHHLEVSGSIDNTLAEKVIDLKNDLKLSQSV